jgi:hypothetical protein
MLCKTVELDFITYTDLLCITVLYYRMIVGDGIETRIMSIFRYSEIFGHLVQSQFPPDSKLPSKKNNQQIPW